jgi:hypothetical protein
MGSRSWPREGIIEEHNRRIRTLRCKERQMYRSTSYASQGSKTVFVEMAERSAEAARLLQEARATEPERLPERKGSLAGRAVSRRDHLLEGLGKRTAQLRAEARG